MNIVIKGSNSVFSSFCLTLFIFSIFFLLCFFTVFIFICIIISLFRGFTRYALFSYLVLPLLRLFIVFLSTYTLLILLFHYLRDLITGKSRT